MATDGSNRVDEYLVGVASDETRESLSRLRTIIREEAPDAEESISYGIPSYKLQGYLIGFAAFKNHCSLFPGGTVANFATELDGYQTSKGTIQFSPDNPLPESLVRTIVKARVAENLASKKG